MADLCEKANVRDFLDAFQVCREWVWQCGPILCGKASGAWGCTSHHVRYNYKNVFACFGRERALRALFHSLALKDSSGYILEEGGFTVEKLEHVKYLKNVARARISKYLDKYPEAKFVPNARPWSSTKCELAFPCATQNEVSEEEAEALIEQGCTGVFEGANMPSSPGAIAVYVKRGILFGPAKAANAGGVAVSGLEMAQNSQRLPWSKEEVDIKLKGIMKSIYEASVSAAEDYGMAKDSPG